MLWKILIEVFPFLWECFFGKKLHKEEPPPKTGNSNVKDKDNPEEEKVSVKGLKAFIKTFNKSPKIAAAVILFLLVSLFANYHLIGRIVAITRDEIGKHVVTTPTVSPTPTKPKEDSDYYNHLLEHLRTTYEE